MLDVALRLAARLRRGGVRVTLTRERAEVSISNAERALLAGKVGADMTLRIHCDGVRRAARPLGFLWRGSLTLVPSRAHVSESLYHDSLRIARCVHPAQVRATGFKDRGIAERGDLSGFNWSPVPVVLLELGYLTNPFEERRLVRLAFRERVAGALAGALVAATPRILDKPG